MELTQTIDFTEAFGVRPKDETKRYFVKYVPIAFGPLELADTFEAFDKAQAEGLTKLEPSHKQAIEKILAWAVRDWYIEPEGSDESLPLPVKRPADFVYPPDYSYVADKIPMAFFMLLFDGIGDTTRIPFSVADLRRNKEAEQIRSQTQWLLTHDDESRRRLLALMDGLRAEVEAEEAETATETTIPMPSSYATSQPSVPSTESETGQTQQG